MARPDADPRPPAAKQFKDWLPAVAPYNGTVPPEPFLTHFATYAQHNPMPEADRVDYR